jgi:hypothetical protein
MNYPLIGFIAVAVAIVALAFVIIKWGGVSNENILGQVYQGEDLHLRIAPEPTTMRIVPVIDLPLQHVPDVGELPGDEDVARFWGTHPSGKA